MDASSDLEFELRSEMRPSNSLLSERDQMLHFVMRETLEASLTIFALHTGTPLIEATYDAGISASP